MSVEQSITEKLTHALAPSLLEVNNESHRHQGHAGSPGTGESHFHVVIVSDAFSGKGRIERHRQVNDILRAELSGALHALTIAAMTPEEHASQSN